MIANVIHLDGREIPVRPGQTVLEVAREAGLDIPTLCYLEKCGPLNTCQVCLVKIDGKLVPSCGMKAQPGMRIESETEEVHEARRTALELLFSDHVGDCLAPCQRLCPLGMNIPVLLRQVQAGEDSKAIETVRNALPLAGVLGRLCHHPCEQGCRRGHWDDPAGIRNIERFAVEREQGQSHSSLPPRKAITGKSIAVVGAGPVGLGAVWAMAMQGHSVTVLDRNAHPGGTLRSVDATDLPRETLARELTVLKELGVHFQCETQLGVDVSLEQLAASHDAVLLAFGQISLAEVRRIGLPATAAAQASSDESLVSIHADPNSMQTGMPKVFAAGSAVRPVRQIVRALAEGKAAAECIDRFLKGNVPLRAERVFSSVMGRLQPAELKPFLAQSNASARVSPCDRCAGLNRSEAPAEASRCLHCDCRASGNCVLQHYAQAYNVDASRFRSERRPFEQQQQPGGVVFEPGKCILCGICVKLTELAAEPLGLTFIGRGFDVRLAAPLNHTIEEGLRKTAAECVEHCPTGALAFREPPQTR